MTEDLASHVREFVPNAAGEDLKLRIQLLKARGYGSMMCATSTDQEAIDLAAHARDLADRFAYSKSASLDRLRLARDCVRRMVSASMILEQLNPGD